jgi:hypothetical protein
MKILMPDEAKAQGVLTKRDLVDIVRALRYQAGVSSQRSYIARQRRDDLADKIEINIQRAFGKGKA